MRILHLTDTHLFAEPGTRHYDRIDTHLACQGVLSHLDALSDVDLVVHSGDASEDGSEASYEHLHALLDPFAQRLGAPLVVAMGNHDVSAAYARVRGAGDRGDHVQDCAVDLPGGGRVIVLDSSVPGAGYGDLGPEQLAWLQEVLREPAPAAADGTAVGSVLVVHHPPLPGATELLAALELGPMRELEEVLRGSDVRVILSGHYHHAMFGMRGEVPVHVAPGITNVVDVLGAGAHETALALSGASLVELQPGAAPVVTSMTWPNTGDLPGQTAAEPVYDLGLEQVRAIARAAGRPQ